MSAHLAQSTSYAVADHVALPHSNFNALPCLLHPRPYVIALKIRSNRSAMSGNASHCHAATSDHAPPLEPSKVAVQIEEFDDLVYKCVLDQGHSQEDSRLITKVKGFAIYYHVQKALSETAQSVLQLLKLRSRSSYGHSFAEIIKALLRFQQELLSEQMMPVSWR